MVKEKENNVLTLVRAGGDALDVELLHDDKQDGDGNEKDNKFYIDNDYAAYLHQYFSYGS